MDAHVYAARTYDFLLSYGINSWDNAGSSMISVVEKPSWGLFYWDNAMWDPSTRKVIYGMVDPMQYRAFSAAIDIVGHEWAHGFTNLHSNLNYSGESGALNEAFSDWVGVSLKRSLGRLVWTQGEDARLGAPLRDLSNPTSRGQPDTFLGPNWWPITGSCDTSNDNCGVHRNSGVPNKMFYLLAESGVHSHRGIAVNGLGLDVASKIAIETNRKMYWGSNLVSWLHGLA